MSEKQEHLVCALSAPEPKAILDALRKKYQSLKITYYALDKLAWNLDQLPDEAYKGATVIASLSALPSTSSATPDLRFVQVFSGGTNHLEKSAVFNDSNIAIANCAGLHGPPIGEWVVMTMLAHSRWYNLFHENQKKHHWAGEDVRYRLMHEMHDSIGRRVGVLGYGSIGRQVARVCKAMGLDVVAYTASARTTPESRRDTGYIVPGTGDPDGVLPSRWYSGKEKKDLHEFLAADLDFVVLSVPLTEATHGLLGEEEFEVLSRKHTFVSNVARGEVVDTAALIKALRRFKESDGKEGIRGAALDVTSPEPLPEDHELWDAPNVIITPHISGVIYEWLPRCFEILDINLERLLSGKKPLNLIDRQKGYSSKISIL